LAADRVLVRWLVVGVGLAASVGCRGGPGDPGTSLYVTNHRAEEVRVSMTVENCAFVTVEK
jgi:hypothetical protein